jgi:GT2 family glycosyltransferase
MATVLETGEAKTLQPVGVLIVIYQGIAHLPDLMQSLLASHDPGIEPHIILVDNASTDASPDWIENHYPPAQFPHIHLIRSAKNLGFAGGNNVALEQLKRFAPAAKYAALLNQDTRVASGWLAALTGYLDGHPVVAAAQAKVMLDPQTTRFNTAGNQSNILGFGFTTAFQQEDTGQFDAVRTIDFPSGAAAMVRIAALPDGKLFDDEMFCYLEDADLGWKLRQMGYRIAYVPKSVVYHKYAFQHEYAYYYYLERNRLLLLATYYKLPTLLLLSPILLAMEVGQLYFAWRQGVMKQRLAAWGYFLDPKKLRSVFSRRNAAQRRRMIDDRAFLSPFASNIEFAELRSRLLKRIGNPLLRGYWTAAYGLLRW